MRHRLTRARAYLALACFLPVALIAAQLVPGVPS
ncbi:hypothetical protein SAMN05444374_11665 [Rhodococcoides kroppenstedtii]|uniref:Uncharacterized protein n=1 Tax=Rhodococcoides kroppenstedtii TaxID=293050 RepID=A0A1I0UAL1_9NOCA|nr:hypothetical protein SAMN05444374_11665 [Rhodococcus kroppenstedtii]